GPERVNDRVPRRLDPLKIEPLNLTAEDRELVRHPIERNTQLVTNPVSGRNDRIPDRLTERVPRPRHTLPPQRKRRGRRDVNDLTDSPRSLVPLINPPPTTLRNRRLPADARDEAVPRGLQPRQVQTLKPATNPADSGLDT